MSSLVKLNKINSHYKNTKIYNNIHDFLQSYEKCEISNYEFNIDYYINQFYSKIIIESFFL